ncbi:hypothetical protein LINPERHAP2_LOCUS3212 [Linum perenne]
MREKSRERRKGVSRGFESSRVDSLGFRSKAKVRSLRAIKIRGREIDISSTSFPVDADFRISVTFSDALHFIFLDVALLKWLKGVLQEAREKGWILGKGLLKRSGSRVIQVGEFLLRDERLLRIMEVCGNGKRFFVSIPMDEYKIGWGSWLKTIQSVLEERVERQVNLVRNSFAEVVHRGVCDKEGAGSSVIPYCVVPLESGFERKSVQLESWVVISFALGPNGYIAWGDFRRWMRRWWGVNLDGEVKRLGDDSWLVECESGVRAAEIVERGHWYFRGASVEVSRWFPDAGRTNLLELQGFKWVLIFGVPVHLRSEVVFRSIGDLCGGYVDSQDTEFSAVRVKVKREGETPTSLILVAKEKRFEIRILEEPSFPGVVGAEKQRESKESIFLPAPEVGRLEEGDGNVQVAARFGEKEGVGSDGLYSKPKESMGGARGSQEVSVGPGVGLKFGEANDIQEVSIGPGIGLKYGAELGCTLSPEAELIKAVLGRPLGRTFEPTTGGFCQVDLEEGWACSFKGLMEDMLLSSFSPQPEVNKEAVQELDRAGLVIDPIINVSQMPSCSFSLPIIEEDCRISEDGDLVESLGDDSDCEEVERNVVLGIGAGECVVEEVSCSNSDWDTISNMGQSLVNFFDFRLEGSKETALEEVERVTKEVLRRRGHSVPKSKRELELRRLDWNLAETTLAVSARSSRYVSPDLLNVES